MVDTFLKAVLIVSPLLLAMGLWDWAYERQVGQRLWARLTDWLGYTQGAAELIELQHEQASDETTTEEGRRAA